MIHAVRRSRYVVSPNVAAISCIWASISGEGDEATVLAPDEHDFSFRVPASIVHRARLPSTGQFGVSVRFRDVRGGYTAATTRRSD